MPVKKKVVPNLTKDLTPEQLLALWDGHSGLCGFKVTITGLVADEGGTKEVPMTEFVTGIRHFEKSGNLGANISGKAPDPTPLGLQRNQKGFQVGINVTAIHSRGWTL